MARAERSFDDAALLDLDVLARRLRAFAEERAWSQFHSPKNLAMALIVEAAELVEHFQWLSEDASARLNDAQRREVALEIADIQIYLTRLADRLGIDVGRAVAEKMALNARKYPAAGATFKGGTTGGR